MGKTAKQRQKGKVSQAKRKVGISKLQLDLIRSNEQHRGRKSVSIAKLMMTNPDFSIDTCKVDIAKAYEIRIREMLDDRNIEHANVAYNSVIKKYPVVQNHFSTHLLIYRDLVSSNTEILNKYGICADTTSKINDFIYSDLADLYLLAEHSTLPASNTLKQDATFIIKAWNEIENLPDNEKHYGIMLKTIRRHSPMIAWRLFLQALKAFYVKDDTSALECIKRIKPDSPVYSLSSCLNSMITNQECDIDGFSKLKRDVFGVSMRDRLEELENLIKKGRKGPALALMTALCESSYWKNRSGLLRNVITSFISLCDDNDIDYSSVIHNLPGGFHSQLVDSYNDDMDEPEDWKYLLRNRKNNFSELEKSLINQRIGELIFKPNSIFDSFDISFPFFGKKEPTKHEKLRAYEKAEEYFLKSTRHYPRSETYKKWFGCAKKVLSPAKSAKILEQWYSKFPEDEYPLFELVNSCRKRGVFRKAEKYNLTLIKLAPNHPKQIKLTNYLLIDDALNYLKRNEYSRSLLLLKKIMTTDDSFVLTMKVLLECLAECKLNFSSKNLSYREKLLVVRQPAMIHYFYKELFQTKLKKDAKKPDLSFLNQQLNDPDITVKSFLDLLRINDSIWGNFQPAYLKLGIDIFKNTNLPSNLLCECFERINEKFANSMELIISPWGWDLTANGICRSDSYLPKFLIYRALIVHHIILSYWSNSYRVKSANYLEKRFHAIKNAATIIAKNSNDTMMIHYIEFFLEKIQISNANSGSIGNISKKQLDKIIECEKKAAFESVLRS
jgi:hypothetical protein